MKKIIIITDLDGTLLDPVSYSFQAALPALRLIKERRVPLVMCSSKTRVEIEYYRNRLENTDPFISENGGALFIPRGYFQQEAPLLRCEERSGGYRIIRLGEKYEKLRRAISELQDEGFGIYGFGDMTSEQIANITGLSNEEAVRASKREFDEPFLFDADENMTEKLIHAVREKGFDITRGAFYHILGKSDKGKAVSLLTGMYDRELGDVCTIAIGDSPNDLPMLRNVDIAVIVERRGGGYDPVLSMQNFERVEGVGPTGWSRAVMRYLEEVQTDN